MFYHIVLARCDLAKAQMVAITTTKEAKGPESTVKALQIDVEMVALLHGFPTVSSNYEKFHRSANNASLISPLFKIIGNGYTSIFSTRDLAVACLQEIIVDRID